ncbi:MAG: hypothetical protein Q8M09_20665 [Pseudomonadota bacterium]|nr:hypothetical protein [Pseudomonadota bacterium]MDP2351689.1 hypothetical protein [Pseudomonadota bacterium]
MPTELAEIIQWWRDAYTVKRTPSPDIRATLRALESDTDGEICRAVTRLDTWTDSAMCGAMYRLWRNEHPEGDAPDTLFSNREWTPDSIREAARYALAHMKRLDGRPSQKRRDVEFSMALVRYWIATTGKRPTVTVKTDVASESPFLKWAHGLFFRAGRRINVDDLARALRRAVRERAAWKSRLRG